MKDFEPRDPDFERRVRESFARQRAMETFGARLLRVAPGEVEVGFEYREEFTQQHGYLHAGLVAALADTACGYGCLLSLPDGAVGFTTIELKTNFIRTAREGTLTCEARRRHGGRTTQLWDATVTGPGGEVLALFRCTQLLLSEG